MKNRLIELLRKSAENARSVDEAADYLISNGVFVLPARVGQKAYWFTGLEIREYTILGIIFDKDNKLRLDLGDIQPIYPWPDHIYLTREEAEKHRKEVKIYEHR